MAEWSRQQRNLRPPGVVFICQATDKSAAFRFMRAVLCVCSFCGLEAEWFRRERNMGPPGLVMRAVLCLCSFRGPVAEWFRRQVTCV